ncbi:hypothetical protein [Streptomyces sp. NPDC002588]|uniref:hypothetical protein n=1 Tax=Streptomyces sp. NPDC002588 TaxID=3154419 RepID=UPI00332AE319
MAAVVSPEIGKTLRTDQSLLIEVRSALGAATAVRDGLLGLTARDAAGEVERVAYVSPVVPLPDRQLVLVDFGALPAETVLAVPQLLTEWLGDADVTVDVAQPGRLDDLEGFGTAAWAYVRAAPGWAPATPLLTWLAGRRLSLFVYGVESPVPAGKAAEAVADLPAGAVATLADLDTDLVAGSIGGPASTLVTAGHDWSPAEVAERMRALRDLLRDWAAGLDWAGVSAERSTRRITVATPDLGTPPVTWWQYLSAAQLQRRGVAPDGTVPLPGGGVELTVGEPEQWLPGHPDGAAVRDEARRRLTG